MYFTIALYLKDKKYIFTVSVIHPPIKKQQHNQPLPILPFHRESAEVNVTRRSRHEVQSLTELRLESDLKKTHTDGLNKNLPIHVSSTAEIYMQTFNLQIFKELMNHLRYFPIKRKKFVFEFFSLMRLNYIC